MKFPARWLVDRAVLLLVGLGLWVGTSQAASLRDDFLVSQWETEDGLPENSATSVAQTGDGHLWVGTFNGLVRFDGLELRVFNPANTPALPSEGIVNLHRHHSDRLWVSTLKGLASFHNGVWQRHGDGTTWSNRYVRTFATNARGALAATSFDGAICRLEGERLLELPAPLPPGQRGAGFHGHVDPAGTLWAARYDYFGRWDGTNWVASASAAVVTNDFRCAAAARDGALWVLTRDRLFKLDGDRVRTELALDGGIAAGWMLTEDPDGTLWFPTYQAGLIRISTTGAVSQFRMRDGLSYDALRCAFRCRAGNLWVGTSGGGLMRLQPRVFRTYGTEDALGVRVVKSVAEEAPGRLLLATYGGGAMRLTPEDFPRVTKLGTGESYAQAILVDRSGRQWVGGHKSPLVVRSTAEVRSLPAEASGGDSVTALFEDAGGRVWVGGSQGVVRHAGGDFTEVPRVDGGALPGVRGFAQTGTNGPMWAASVRGLAQLVNDRWEAIAEPASWQHQGAHCLLAEADGTVWVGTANAGLWRWRGDRWSGKQAGLASDAVNGLVDDGLGHLWITSNRGITRVRRESLQAVADGRAARIEATVLGVGDGLPSMECPGGQQPTAMRDSTGGCGLPRSKAWRWRTRASSR